MEQKKMKTFREKLLLKKQEILVAYTKNKSYGKEADEEGAQDIADKASNSYTKEFLFSLSNNERDMLQLVDEALVRIDDRRFGVCVVCEDEMDRKRLEAVPWAKRCISCQEKQGQGLLWAWPPSPARGSSTPCWPSSSPRSAPRARPSSPRRAAGPSARRAGRPCPCMSSPPARAGSRCRARPGARARGAVE